MVKIKSLDSESLKLLLSINDIIQIVENVYKSKACNSTMTWPTIFYEFQKGKADMDIKSGYIQNENIFGHKTASWFQENEVNGLPTLNGLITIYNAKNGIPIGITGAEYITGIRTGASSAVTIKHLANKTSEDLLIIGSGNQALFQIASAVTVLPNLKNIRVYSRNIEKTKLLTSNLKKNLKENFNIFIDDIEIINVINLRENVESSDVIITITPSKEPLIEKEWIKKGTHISCVGADMPDKQEIDPQILKIAKVYVDDLEHCIKSGEIEKAIKKGTITAKNIYGTVGEVIIDNIRGRTSQDDITVVDLTGMALLDIGTAYHALKLANQNNIRTTINI